MATSQPLPAGLPAGASTLTLDVTGPADVNEGIKKAGMSFGKLLESTGLAVAESSRQLNEVGADMTSALARQQVDVIAAQVNAYNDDGTLNAAGTRTLTQKLPLINFIDPVFYEWTQVRLQGIFQATELVTSNEASTTTVSASASATNTGTGFFFGVGSNRFSFGIGTASSDVDTSTETSFGAIRASALLQPKTDIGVPKPRQLLSGPSFGILFGPDVADDATSRSKEISVVCFKADGSPQTTALPVSIELTGAQWAWKPPAPGNNQPVPDATGAFGILISRDFPVQPGEAGLVDKAPVEVTMTVRMGVVSTTAVIRF
jgi:hypothetical protein